MFRHVVMMAWTDESTADQRQAAIDAVRTLPDLVPSVRGLSCGFDAGVVDGNFDFVAVVDFDDRAGYELYATHPDHVQVITERLRPIAAQRAAVQYELADHASASEATDAANIGGLGGASPREEA